jgi:acyl carrier protein phosphodiesterase
MTYDPTRHRGNRGACTRARRMSAGVHEGDPAAYLRRHEWDAIDAVRADRPAQDAFLGTLLARTADTRNLRLSWDHVLARDGDSPHHDDLHDLEDGEVWELLRTLRQALLSGTYRTSPDRLKRIPKASSKGTRTLCIPTTIDRMVQRAIVQTVQPYLDPMFEECSLGYRPGYNINTALALAEQRIVEGDAWVLVSEDLSNAFDHVPQKRLLDVIRIHLREERMVRLLEQVVQTSTGKGIRQGSNASPLFLNLFLDHFLDKKWCRLHPDVPLLRWADDLLIPCSTLERAKEAYQSLKALLRPAGMQLKSGPEMAIRNLWTDDHVDWLGYRLTQGENGLKVTLTDKAWRSLATKLELCHEKDGSPVRAVETIGSWISAMGPCYVWTDVPRAYARIVSLAHNLGFDELPSLEEVSQTWYQAHEKWSRCRRVATGELGDGVAAPPRDSENGWDYGRQSV